MITVYVADAASDLQPFALLRHGGPPPPGFKIAALFPDDQIQAATLLTERLTQPAVTGAGTTDSSKA